MKLAALLSLLFLPVLGAQVKVTPAANHISVEIDGKPFGDLVFGPDVWKPYFYPLRSASGKIVTRMYPMDKTVAGEAHDHNHHRGLTFAHIDVNGVDFWSSDPLNKPSPKYGRIVLDKVGAAKSGKKSGSLAIRFKWNAPDGHTMLTENRTMTFIADDKLRIVDVDIILTPAEKLNFGDDKDGTFNIRMAAPLQEQKASGKITDADGRATEKEVWGKRSNWADYSGTIDGEQVGIAIFDHAQNPGHPVHWHARAYGLFSANPFGSKTFDKNNPEGGMTFEANKPIHFRYRVVIHPAGTDLADLYKKWK